MLKYVASYNIVFAPNALGAQMKFRSAVVATAVSMLGALIVSTSQPAAATGVGGAFVPVTPVRIADTIQGTNTSASKITTSSDRDITVLGVGGIPSTGVSAVVLDVAASASDHTNVYVRAKGADSHSSFLSTGDTSGWQSNTVIVAPGTSGKVTFSTSYSSINMNVDVQGYFTSGNTGSTSGGFVPLDPTRVINTTDGTGLPLAKLSGGSTIYQAQIAGRAGVPSNATAVFGNFRVTNASDSGRFKVGPSGSSVTANPTSLDYNSGVPSDSGMSVKLGSDGKIDMNINNGTADVLFDVQGYFTPSSGGDGYNPLTNTRVYTSSDSTPLAGGETRQIPVVGHAGVPSDGSADAVAMTISVGNWTASGSITVDDPDVGHIGTSNVAFKAPFDNDGEFSTSIVQLSSTGTIEVTNNSSGSVDVTFAAQGWFSLGDSAPTAFAAAPTVDQSTAGSTRLGAVVSDSDGTATWAEFTVKRDTTTVFKGLSTSGAGTTQYVDVPNLPKGQYTVTARAYDGRLYSATSTPSASFSVGTDSNDVLGDSFNSASSTQVASLTLAGATPADGASQAFVQVAGIGAVPDDQATGHAAVVSIRATGWSSGGGVSVVNPDGEVPATANLNIVSSMSPSTALASTSIVVLSEDGQVALLNTSTDPVSVVVSVQGWYGMTAPPVAAPIGPEPNAQVIDTPAQSPVTLTFAPPVASSFTLANTADQRVAMSLNGTQVGNYSSSAIDDAGVSVPVAISSSGGNLVVVVSPSSDTEYPVTVVPTFEALNPSSPTVQNLYPAPDTSVDAAEVPLTAEDVVDVTDEARQQLVEDLKSPDDSLSDAGIAAQSGQVTTLAASHAKVTIPHWLRSNGSRVIPKYYVYDPNNKNGRNPARNQWHDYCTGKSYFGAPDSAKFTGPNGTDAVTVSFKGPCARHDLCIQWKEAPNRHYCDPKLKADIRQNCRYYIRADLHPHRAQQLSNCYGRAGNYYYWVNKQTNSYSDPGQWGHHDNSTVYPTYRWDVW